MYYLPFLKPNILAMNAKATKPVKGDLSVPPDSEENSDKILEKSPVNTKTEWERFMGTVFGRMFKKI